jgi:hypothetical protein
MRGFEQYPESYVKFASTGLKQACKETSTADECGSNL